MSKSREQIINFLKTIDITDKTVLDIGAGPKEWWAWNFTTGIPCIYKTLDINPTFGTDYVRDLNELQGWEFLDDDGSIVFGGFDITFCLETLEHLWNPVIAIKSIAELTRGTAYISVPFINPLHDTHDYLRYTIQWFEKVLPLYGFKDIKIIPRTATAGKEDLNNFYKNEGMRMSKVTQEQGYGENYYDIGYIVEAHK